MEVVAIEDRFGQSGTLQDLLQEYGLTTEHICHKVRLVRQRSKL